MKRSISSFYLEGRKEEFGNYSQQFEFVIISLFKEVILNMLSPCRDGHAPGRAPGVVSVWTEACNIMKLL